MGWEYAFVHIYKTIPLATILHVLYYPLFTRVDIYKICFLITIAVTSTIPWDAYLIRTEVWSYPPHAILGPTLFGIPIEEVFFFVIQTYITSVLYLIFTKGTLQAVYLVCDSEEDKKEWRSLTRKRNMGFAVLLSFIAAGLKLVTDPSLKKGTYLGLILLWSMPFLTLLWGVGYPFLLRLPFRSNVMYPILIPTLFLCWVDARALGEGTWVIEEGTKTGWKLMWPLKGLEIEEAFFFLITNTLIIWGLVAFDHALAILSLLHTSPSLPNTESTSTHTRIPSPFKLVQALLMPASSLDSERLHMLRDATRRLGKKSRSFSFASGLFEELGGGGSGLRSDLVLLYSFCRVADDLVDDASSPEEAREQLRRLHRYLHLIYGSLESGGSENPLSHPTPMRAPIISESTTVDSTDPVFLPPCPMASAQTEQFSPETETRLNTLLQSFPVDARMSLRWLRRSDTRDRVREQPLRSLLQGFEMDLDFSLSTENHRSPIQTSQDLELYARRVAGTVAELIIDLILFHYGCPSSNLREKVIYAGREMGVALQYVNIARDVQVDARMGRCYFPEEWFGEAEGKMRLEDIFASPAGQDSITAQQVRTMRLRLLSDAGRRYEANIDAISSLPDWTTGWRSEPEPEGMKQDLGGTFEQQQDRRRQYVGGVRGAARAAVESYMEIGRRLHDTLRKEVAARSVNHGPENGNQNGDANGRRLSKISSKKVAASTVNPANGKLAKNRPTRSDGPSSPNVPTKASVSTLRRLVVGWMALFGRTIGDPIEVYPTHAECSEKPEERANGHAPSTCSSAG